MERREQVLREDGLSAPPVKKQWSCSYLATDFFNIIRIILLSLTLFNPYDCIDPVQDVGKIALDPLLRLDELSRRHRDGLPREPLDQSLEHEPVEKCHLGIVDLKELTSSSWR